MWFSVFGGDSGKLNPILAGFFVTLRFGSGVKMACPPNIEICILFTWDLEHRFKQMKNFKKRPEGFVHCLNFAEVSTFLTVITNFP